MGSHGMPPSPGRLVRRESSQPRAESAAKMHPLTRHRPDRGRATTGRRCSSGHRGRIPVAVPVSSAAPSASPTDVPPSVSTAPQQAEACPPQPLGRPLSSARDHTSAAAATPKPCRTARRARLHTLHEYTEYWRLSRPSPEPQCHQPRCKRAQTRRHADITYPPRARPSSRRARLSCDHSPSRRGDGECTAST